MVFYPVREMITTISTFEHIFRLRDIHSQNTISKINRGTWQSAAIKIEFKIQGQFHKTCPTQ